MQSIKKTTFVRDESCTRYLLLSPKTEGKKLEANLFIPSEESSVKKGFQKKGRNSERFSKEEKNRSLQTVSETYRITPQKSYYFSITQHLTQQNTNAILYALFYQIL